MAKIKDTEFCVKKKAQKCFDLSEWGFKSNPRFSVNFRPQFEFSCKVRVTRSNLGKEVKILNILKPNT